MNDDLIRELGQTALRRGGMQELRRHFSAQSIAGEDLDFKARGQVVFGHVLLHSISGADRCLELPYSSALEALCGTGQHYNGTFGKLPPSGVLQFGRHQLSLDGSDEPPADIGTRVTLCLDLLSTARRLDGSGLHEAVQRCLNDLLLAHPVLLHPKILVPTHRTGTGLAFMSVAHAAVSARDIGLPRLSHYPEGERSARVESLRAFARHPCVVSGLGKSRFIQFDQEKQALVQDLRSHAEHGLVPVSPRLQIMGSAMELQQLRERAGTDLELPLQPSSTEGATNVVQTMAMALLAGSGAAAPATASDGLRYPQAIDPDLLAQIRLRQAAIDRAGLRSEFKQKLSSGAVSRVFGGRFEAITLTEMEQATRAIVQAFVLSGVSSDTPAAAQELMALTLGPERLNGNLPRVEVPTAIGFLRVMDSLGLFGSMEPLEPDEPAAAELAMRAWRQVIGGTPVRDIPHRDEWLCAIDVWWREKVLLRAVSSAPDTALHSQQTTPDSPNLARRRHAL
jgi:hypothetical protein